VTLLLHFQNKKQKIFSKQKQKRRNQQQIKEKGDRSVILILSFA